MDIGKRGEELAAGYLQNKDYAILARNFRTKMGEIDIVARDKRTLVFCEVKTRVNETYGKPFEAVTFRKQQTIRKVAEAYISRSLDARSVDSIRFDVLSILARGAGFEIEHIKNAF